MTRHLVAAVCLAGLAVVVAVDLSAVTPNPYHAPAMLALGSGQAAAGGFCGALPR